MSRFWQDFRGGVRFLSREPAFALVAIFALALGIGATTSIFSVVNAVLLVPYPYEAPERLAVVWERQQSRGLPRMFASPPNYADWRERNQSFSDMGAFTTSDFFLEPQDGLSTRVRGARVTASMMRTLEVSPVIGRLFDDSEDQPGGSPTALISHRLWQSRFASSPSVPGQSFRLNGQEVTIVGVMPAAFEFPPPISLEGTTPSHDIDIWVPFSWDISRQSRGAHYVTVIARLRDGMTIQQASSDMRAIAAQLESEYPQSNSGWDIVVTPLQEEVTGPIRPALLVLLGAVGLVLLIACVNVANLLLARGAARRKEFAIRTALGAASGRLVRQSLTESLALALPSGALGLLMAVWGTQALLQLAPQNVPRLDQASMDLRVAAFTLTVSLLTGLLFGIAPALQSFSGEISQKLRSGGRSQAEGRSGKRLRSALVVAEVALCLILLTGAGLLFLSFVQLRSVDAGFGAQNVMTARIALPSSRYSGREQWDAAYRELERQLNAAPGVVAAGFTLDIPLAQDRQGTGFFKEGEPLEETEENRQINFSFVTPGYFPSMGIQLLQGRLFSDADQAGREDVLVINQEMAHRFFPQENPIGQQLRLGFSLNKPRRIVGIVASVRHDTLRSDPNPAAYVPYSQQPWSSRLSLTVKGEQALSPSMLRSLVGRFDSSLPIYDIQTMEQVLDASSARLSFSYRLLGLFSAAALLLAAIGLYGVISYSVTRRIRDTGVRIALGASQGRILRMVAGQGLRLAALGVVLGIAGSMALSRILASLLYGVEATDPVVLASVSVLMLSVAVAASLIPARRATLVDPVVALRRD